MAPVRQEVENFLSQPSRESYQSLRQVVMESPDYRPDSDVVDQFWQALDADRLTEAEEMVRQLVPTHLVNPRAHLGLAYLHGQKGDSKGEQFEFYFCQQLRRFLMESGDGSCSRPYRVTSVDEIHYAAGVLEAQVRQVNCEWVAGRLHDVLLTDKGEFYFESHLLLAAYR